MTADRTRRAARVGLLVLCQAQFSNHDPDDQVPDLPVKAQGESRTRIVNEVLANNPGMTLRQLYKHPLTDKGLTAFLDDWAKTGQTILGN